MNREGLLFGWPHMQHDAANALDAAFDSVARIDSAHAFRRSGEDQVARSQVVEQRQVGDLIADVPDQLVDSGFMRLGAQATTSRPRFCTRCSSLRAVPVGFFWPISHFCTALRLVFSRRAKTAWLTREVSRMCLICSGCSGSTGVSAL